MHIVSVGIKRWTAASSAVVHILGMHGRDAMRKSLDWSQKKMTCFVWLWIHRDKCTYALRTGA